jgi:hypothetical protein
LPLQRGFSTGALLDDVRELVSKETVAGGGARLEPTLRKMDVRAHRKGLRIDPAGRAGRASIGMQPDIAEVVPEARLEVLAHRAGHRLARASRSAEV